MITMQQLMDQHNSTMCALNAVETKLGSAVKSGDANAIMALMEEASAIHSESIRKSQEAISNVR